MAITFYRPDSPPPNAQYSIKHGNIDWYLTVTVVDRLQKIVRIDLFNGDDLDPTLTLAAKYDDVLGCGENIAWHIGVNTADVEIFIYWVYRIVISTWDDMIPAPELHAIIS